MRPMNSLANWAINVANIVVRIVVIVPVLVIGGTVVCELRRRRL